MLNRLDYSYNGENSIIDRLNPVVKIFGLFIYCLISLLKFNNLLFIVNISLVFMFILLSNVKITRYLKIVWELKYIIIIMYTFMYSKNMAFFDMNVIVFKWIFFVLYIFLIIYTTTKEDLGKGSAKILNIINIIGISIRKIANLITNILVFIELLIQTYIDILTNYEVKGKVYSHSNIIDKCKLVFSNTRLVFKKTKEKMKTRNSDKRYKLYNGNVKSKYKYRNKLCIFDYIFIIFNVGMIIFYILKVR